MKKLVKTLVVCGFVFAFATTAAFGDPLYTITLDENGNGALTGLPAGPISIPGVIGTDQSSGLTGLYYDLGPLVFSLSINFTHGDVELFEPGAALPSDLLRFINGGGHQGIFFLSLLDDASHPDLADVSLLPDPVNPLLTFVENGPEGSNGFFYVPPNQSQSPGFVPEAPGQFGYNFISDVPEPSTMVLAGLAVAGLAVPMLRRRRNSRRYRLRKRFA